MAITYTLYESLKENTREDLSFVDFNLVNFICKNNENKSDILLKILPFPNRPMFVNEVPLFNGYFLMNFLDEGYIINDEHFLCILLTGDLNGGVSKTTFYKDSLMFLNNHSIRKDTINLILNDYMTIDVLKDNTIEDLIKLYDMYSIDKEEEEKSIERFYIEFYSQQIKNGVVYD